MKTEIQKQTLTHLISFMNGCSLRNDIEGVAHTHLSFGDLIQGRFYISKEKHEDFINLYCEAIKYNKLSIIECPMEFNPILIDIDLTGNELKENGRLYSAEDIQHLLNIYTISLNKLFNIKKYNFHIFEKPHARKIGDCYKDGFHIVIPKIITGYENKYKLRNMVIELIKKENLFNNCLLTADQIVDKSIIKSN